MVQFEQLLSRIPGTLQGPSTPPTPLSSYSLLFQLLNPQLLEAWYVQEDICYTA